MGKRRLGEDQGAHRGNRKILDLLLGDGVVALAELVLQLRPIFERGASGQVELDGLV